MFKIRDSFKVILLIIVSLEEYKLQDRYVVYLLCPFATNVQQNTLHIVRVSHSVISDSLQPHGLSSTKLLCP